jgi:hypothetical protein
MLRPPQRVITMINSESSGARLHRWRVEPTCGLARRHWAVGVSPIFRSFSSTSLRPFAPDPLRPITALRRSYGRCDSYPLPRGSARALPSGHPLGSSRAGLPDSRTWPADPSVSNHLRALRLAKARYLSADRIESTSLRVSSLRELEASSFASRLAPPRRPNRVSHRTDWPFTSGCFPPRLATTQLPSVTKLR